MSAILSKCRLMNTKVKIGIDYSLNSPGLCIIALNHDGSRTINMFGFKTIKRLNSHYTIKSKLNNDTLCINLFDRPKGMSWEQRIKLNAKFIFDNIPNMSSIAEMHLEGYSFGSSGNSTYEIAENTGHLKMGLLDNDYEFTIVPPKSLKKASTGSGNANKETMIASFINSTGFNDIMAHFHLRDAPLSDIVDAYWLAIFSDHNTSIV